VRLSYDWRRGTAVFDDENLVSCAGLVPVMALAEQTGLPDLLEQRVVFRSERVRSGAANPAPKLTAVIAGMAAGADSVDDLDVIRAGGMKKLFGAVYAPSTLGILLREFSHGHTRQLSAVLRGHLLALTARTGVLDGIEELALVDIDSLLRRVYGHAKQGASFGHTKIASRQVLRKGLSPLVTTISTGTSAPVIAGIRLRAGKASGKGAASMVTEAINTAKAAGAVNILVRGDSAYGNGMVIAAGREGRREALVRIGQKPVGEPGHRRHRRGRVDTGALSGGGDRPRHRGVDLRCRGRRDRLRAFAGTTEEITARLIVRRVRDRNHPDELFPAWRYHPFFTTNSTASVTAADIAHRQHAIIESVFADVIDGPLAHLPSESFSANSAWTVLAAITHNLLRAAGTLASKSHARARGATLRRHLVNVPARIARPQGRTWPSSSCR
jgi:Transposase DDE domain group 1